MSGDLTEYFYRRFADSEFFSGVRLVRAYAADDIGTVGRVPVVAYGCETAERICFLLGYENLEAGTEKLVVTVLTGERYGGSYCEEQAERICSEILRLDDKKLICSVSAERCVYDRVNFAYRIRLVFGMREIVREV